MNHGKRSAAASQNAKPVADAAELLLALEQQIDAFLVKWPRHMARAGYLAFTTAKKEDCIRSYVGFLQPLWDGLRAGEPMGHFGKLLRRDEGWAQPVLEMSQRHRLRGITPDMFFGCFKTMVHAVAERLHEMRAPPGAAAAAVVALRSYADAMEVVLLASWGAQTQQEQLAHLDASNRELTLQKNRFENIFSTTSDLVLVTDAEGLVDDANTAARAIFADGLNERQLIWDLLDLQADSMVELLRRYPLRSPLEVALPQRQLVLELRIAPLSTVALASSGYLFMLSDITGHVRLRAQLEARVRERTAAAATTAWPACSTTSG